MHKKTFGLIVLIAIVAITLVYNYQKNNFIINNDKNVALDAPGRASLREFDMLKDPILNRIPFEKYPEAITQTNLLKTSNRSLSSVNWTSVPTNMGGRIKTVCVDPNDPNHHKLWAGSATGGLWVNNDISNPNNLWTPVSDVWPTLSISSIVFDPNNSQTMYVGTGEYETAITDIYRESSGRGFGIWKSTDGGQNFQRLLSTQNFAYISDLVIKNNNGQSVIYAGVVSGVYRGGTFNAQPTEGLYRSADGGQTWEQVLPNISGSNNPYAVSDIEITGNGKIIIGTKRNIDDEGGGNILVSNTGNSGSWTVINQFSQQITQDNDYNIPGRVKIASAPSNPNKIYAVFAAKSLQQTIEGFPQTIGKIIASSNNGGQTWQLRNTPQTNGNNWAYLAWHALSVSVDPNNDNRVYIGGLDSFLSTNGGNTWQQVSDWRAMYYGQGNYYVHADIHQILFLSNSSNKLVMASDGGIFYSHTANTNDITFSSRNNNLQTLQFYSAAISYNNGELLAGGLQDNGTVVYNGATITESDMIQGGDGAFCLFDKNEPLLITSTYDNQFKVFNYTTGDENWIYSYASGLFTSTFDYDSQNNIIWTIASDMHNNRLNEVLKLTDITDSETGQFINLNTGATTYFSAIRLLDTNSLLIGTSNGKLYKVTNINSNPVATELGNGVFPDAFISSIQTADNGQRILVTLSNYGVTSIWQSTDSGQNWQNMEGNLPDIPVRWAIYHPANHNQVMIATETGVWTTDNINSTPVVWNNQNNGLPNVRVDMLAVRPDNNKVVAGTHGRGFFTTTWDSTNDINTYQNITFSIYPNPANTFIIIEVEEAYTDLEIEMYDISGKLVKTIKINDLNKKLYIGNLQKGIYFIKLKDIIKKLIIE